MFERPGGDPESRKTALGPQMGSGGNVWLGNELGKDHLAKVRSQEGTAGIAGQLKLTVNSRQSRCRRVTAGIAQ